MTNDLFGPIPIKDDPPEARTLHRTHDRATSVEAAEAMVPRVTAIQRAVLAYARRNPQGFSDVDLARHFNNAGSTYRTRRAELTAKGLIVDSGITKQHPPSRRWHVVWKPA